MNTLSDYQKFLNLCKLNVSFSFLKNKFQKNFEELFLRAEREGELKITRSTNKSKGYFFHSKLPTELFFEFCSNFFKLSPFKEPYSEVIVNFNTSKYLKILEFAHLKKLDSKIKGLKDKFFEMLRHDQVFLKIFKNKDFLLNYSSYQNYFEHHKIEFNIEKVIINYIPCVLNEITNCSPISLKNNTFTNFIREIKLYLLKKGFVELTVDTVLSNEEWSFKNIDIPSYHPVRTLLDTYYVQKNNELVPLLSHITSHKFKKFNQIYTNNIEVKSNYFFALGIVYRREEKDLTHSSFFHQLDISVIDSKFNKQKIFKILSDLYAWFGVPGVKMKTDYFEYVNNGFEIQLVFNNQNMEIGGGGCFYPHLMKNISNNKIKEMVFSSSTGLERWFMRINNIEKIDQVLNADIN